jgi:nitrous oxide reductase accessory protein NosL
MCERCDRPLSRRRLLAATGAVGASVTAGCLAGDGGGQTEAPDPVALTGDKQCEVCGMVIEQHPGPTGQLYYRDNGPEGHNPPAWFCSGWETFTYHFEREERGWTLVAGYMTDYAAVDYDLYEEGGETFVTAHLEPDAFARLEDLYYVVGTDVNGAMGEDLIPFSERDAADQFASDRDGDVYELDGITPTLVAQLGR